MACLEIVENDAEVCDLMESAELRVLRDGTGPDGFQDAYEIMCWVFNTCKKATEMEEVTSAEMIAGANVARMNLENIRDAYGNRRKARAESSTSKRLSWAEREKQMLAEGRLEPID